MRMALGIEQENNQKDYFSLFGLPQSFSLDNTRLEKAWHHLQKQIHPDSFVNASIFEQKLAMQWAARINQAYKVLSTPFLRACYLLELRGVSVSLEQGANLPADFLAQQWKFREALDKAEGNSECLNQLSAQLKKEKQHYYRDIEHHLAHISQLENQSAAQLLRQLIFIEQIEKQCLVALAARNASSN